MTTQHKNKPEFSEPPMFFADQPSALMLGPIVSRITFGIEEMDDGEFPRPVVTIALPTTALLQFVNDVKTALDESDFKKQAVIHLENAARLISNGGAVTPKNQKLELRQSKPGGKKRSIS